MTRSIRRTAWVSFLLFGLLFLNLNWLQVIRADDLANDSSNRRQLLAEYDIRRGAITAGTGADQVTIAASRETDDQLRFLREYEQGPAYAHITGFHSFIFGRTQVESQYNDFLQGSAPETLFRNLGDALRGRERQGDTIVTTVEPAVQQAAIDALRGQTGAVVALDPRSGDVLAMVSAPTYDPNLLSSHDPGPIRDAWESLNADPLNPLLNRSISELYAPGSTFKVITAAASLERGGRPSDTYADPTLLDLPLTTAQIGNFSRGRPCNDGTSITLQRALEVSCNTTFGIIALELGADALVQTAESFGLNSDLDFDVPTETSRIPKELDEPSTAQSAIGQRDVRVTPLQMALVAAAIGNDGIMMRPRLVSEVQDFAGRVVRQYPPQRQTIAGVATGQTVSPQTAAGLTQMMTAVVENGTGQNAAIPGVPVAGKTGTAEQGEGEAPDTWFIGFAPADNPVVAVAVVVEGGGDAGESGTGGGVSAPIARTVLEAALGVQ
ncbi:peptidoglycan D,D-transpeptidase FtsI family protein [Euzebya tangerina]|uniref:peptidoglycan D,D-transpeptidase FtsI family protein n=1 Tax=Euzebya tangerina TaxID=591198 RepID=UPI000E313476|nr:penicillin-binding protein 2 [Euzebya tangerina]